MTHEDFTEEVKRFLSDHGFGLGRKERIAKFYSEVGEHVRAQLFETVDEEKAEAIDCGVTAWCLMLAYGIEDPFAAMLAKLEEAAQRPHYVEMRRRVADDRAGVVAEPENGG